jgi:hypothetical protein
MEIFMRRIILISIVLLLLGCSACSDNDMATASPLSSASSDTATSETAKPRATFEPWENYQNVLPMISIDWVIYPSLDALVDRTDHIAVATVLDIEASLYQQDESERQNDPLQDTMIQYTVRIDEPIKGGLPQGGTIAVWQRGWGYKGVNVWHPDIPPLEADRSYLLFFINNDQPIDTLDVDYYVGMPFESYPEIRSGKLYPHPHSTLFREGQALDDTVFSITQIVEKKAALRDALIGLSAEQGAKRLSSVLSQDQKAVRKLTSEEMQPFFDFAGSDVVKEAAGSKLKNSDIFIWAKTEELTKTQQAALEAALTPVAERIAEKRDWGYQVSVTPFHSLICISRGEDRATIHMAFREILDELTVEK